MAVLNDSNNSTKEEWNSRSSEMPTTYRVIKKHKAGWLVLKDLNDLRSGICFCELTGNLLLATDI